MSIESLYERTTGGIGVINFIAASPFGLMLGFLFLQSWWGFIPGVFATIAIFVLLIHRERVFKALIITAVVLTLITTVLNTLPVFTFLFWLVIGSAILTFPLEWRNFIIKTSYRDRNYPY